jgi:hypothetical protein
LIEIVGKAKVLGAPFLYGTTPAFLEYLGLNSLKDLPSMEDLEALLAREAGEPGLDGEEAPMAEGGGPSHDVTDDDSNELDSVAPLAASAKVGPPVDEPINRPLYDEITAQLRDAAGEVDEEDEDALDSGEDEKSRD